MWRYAVMLCAVVVMSGCQSTHQELLAKGYPPAFADGFDDGCSSGRQAAGVITGEFRKNVPRYLKDRLYAEGWEDGFRQCKAMRENEELRDYKDNHWDDRERAWQQEKDRDAGRAYRSQ
ncbi:hypothetical protein A7317_25205 [Pseudomonas fluorescens]|jgi:hypothetical protein|uniref:Lipoprotein n=3 Tax=Pseudomonas TaxID=286 RepID=A0A5M9INE7_9PSED|nr:MULTISPECIES: hypothetical protein [Pseudomonas]AHC37956.1 hypothetical protein U771_27420 [Pseudomonas sp. TKP]AOE70170.1 hypothetical protein A7317_25205 [Pseudomonas fluorescens]AOE75946.1 hypothetical protein A7319_24970 [Pseudomonas fluorescens]KAA8558284.1 hypothetical protein FX985_04633 [Pseudomonas extremaustralis]MBL1307599.1 hypothetical protein [Pseudomonas sp.]